MCYSKPITDRFSADLEGLGKLISSFPLQLVKTVHFRMETEMNVQWINYELAPQETSDVLVTTSRMLINWATWRSTAATVCLRVDYFRALITQFRFAFNTRRAITWYLISSHWHVAVVAPHSVWNYEALSLDLELWPHALYSMTTSSMSKIIGFCCMLLWQWREHGWSILCRGSVNTTVIAPTSVPHCEFTHTVNGSSGNIGQTHAVISG